MTNSHRDFAKVTKGSKPAPFSLRLTFEERARLEAAANGVPLGAYIKAMLFDGDLSKVRRRNTNPVEDHQALARVLAALAPLVQSQPACPRRKHGNTARSS